MPRPTILDIAKAAGVSKGAVSYALNGRPGVSAQTRERILGIADELGWVPSSAARALSSARAEAVGLIAVRDPELLATEPYFMRLVAGLERVLTVRGVALVLSVVADSAGELDLYHRWWGSRRVDGMLLFDMRVRDPRPAWLREHGVPAVVIGAQRAYRGIACTRVSSQHLMARAVTHLHELGHRRIARVSGPRRLEHVIRREQAFTEVTTQLLGSAQPQVEADYTAAGGIAATRALLAVPEPPTAIIYENDVMAVAALGELISAGVRVPADVAIMAWDDSALCQLVRPAVTAFSHDVVGEAARAADLLLTRIDTGTTPDIWLDPPELTIRESTAGP